MDALSTLRQAQRGSISATIAFTRAMAVESWCLDTTKHPMISHFPSIIFMTMGACSHGTTIGIAFMCPNGVKPDGFVKGNRFVTCEGVPAMYDTPNVPNCSEHMVKTDNRINDGLSYIPEPQVTFNPTGPVRLTPPRSSPCCALLPSKTASCGTPPTGLDQPSQVLRCLRKDRWVRGPHWS